MAALVVDTSSWVSYFAGHGDPRIDEALVDGRAYLSPIVAVELVTTAVSEKRRLKLEDFLQDLPVCATDLGHWLRVGKLRAKLFLNHLRTTIEDAHVAQCAIDLGGELLTEDGIFASIARHVPLRLA